MKKNGKGAEAPERRVFTWVRGDENNSLLHHSQEDWYAYAEGYKRAADAVVREVLRTPGEWDFLVYPACFLYRHYIELRLKQIIRRGGWVAEEPDDLQIGHRLMPAWVRAKAILRKLWPDADTADLTAVEDVIREIDEIDEQSFAFRYPTDKQGKEHLEDIKGINLEHVATVMNGIARTLDGAVAGIKDMTDAKHEAMWEAQQAMHDDYEPPDYEPPDYEPE